MRILGIETSCDETSAAIIEGKPKDNEVKLLSNIVASSLSLHSKIGGIIPEVAAREQVKYIIPVIKKALADYSSSESRVTSRESREVNNLTMEQFSNESMNIDAITVTVGPGLIGSLLVGVETAKTLAYIWKKPIIPVNHLIGHIYANFIKDEKPYASLSLRAKRSHVPYGTWRSNLKGIATSGRTVWYTPPRNDNIDFPAIALIVSGGHTDLVLMKKHGSIKWLGGTRDDAAGEAFDKIGRLLGLPYPGCPSIEKIARNGNPKAFNFPRPMIDSDDFDFSFSGLKTAVFREVKKLYSSSESGGAGESRSLNGKKFSTSSNIKIVADLSASVQQAIIDVVVAKTLKAAQKHKVKSILLSGGVATNQSLREKLNVKCQMSNVNFFAPAKNLCTDNAAMIATAAFFNYKPVPWQKITANPELYFE